MATASDPAAPATPASPQPVVSMERIPDWLITHPELRKRGITLHRPLQPFTVYRTDLYQEGPVHVVKAINPSRQEIAMYDLFDQLSGSPISNHTIPHEIVRCDRPLLIMPFASDVLDICSRSTSSVLAVFDQILEGVEHLHRMRISHGDIFAFNVVSATAKDARLDARLTAGRVYLIDFESCQQFEHGPGVQDPVPLPNTHVDPPLAMKSFDPFSWDVYCLGMTLEFMVQSVFFDAPQESLPGILGLCVRWLQGNEAGCTSVCRCRPTVTRARRVLTVVRWFARVGEFFTTIVTYPMTLFKPPRADRRRD
ncbi:hypothetical protein GSI_02589 [Ganoderma sinense ZZ0214-1]|uniref:Protein kinase domain-containing protein n=1 Tax=Ganoderma sinense ZZ0214-1 TaxID=1077348 RepID=A0A2G8SM18_9APHY|nr:hypothetical protein GSI_02589 [Ganoderma sinense ZZ0214-1]